VANPLHILVVGSDARLRDECVAALTPIVEATPVVHYLADFRQAVEAARSRRPQLVIVEMASDSTAMRTFADELAAASPETRLVGAFKPEIFTHDVSESAVLIEAVRAGVSDFLRRPLSAVDLGQLLDRLFRRVATGPARLGKVIAFISNKGGVGKSTLAVNSAAGVATRHPGRVLLVDASLQMGVCAAMLDLRPGLSLVDAARQHARLDETLLEQLAIPDSSGLHLLAAPADAIEAAEVGEDTVSRVLSLARRTYDYVIVDTFPMFDRVVMAVLDQTDEAYVVLENVVPTLLGAERFLKLLDSVGFSADKQQIVLNRFSRRGGSLRPSDAEERLQRHVDLVVPYDRRLIVAANLGRPFLSTRHPFSRTARRLGRLVADVEQRAGTNGAAASGTPSHGGVSTAGMSNGHAVPGAIAPPAKGKPATANKGQR